MEYAASVIALKQAIAARFPDDAARADACIAGLNQPADDAGAWIEQFAQLTTNAMHRMEERTVRAHLDFISARAQGADAGELEAIDVHYVEHLLLELRHQEKQWAWTLMPEILRRMYIAMWGGVMI
jgi:hypothetical protein